MNATPVARRQIAGYGTWRASNDEAEPLRARYDGTDRRVLRLPGDTGPRIEILASV